LITNYIDPFRLHNFIDFEDVASASRPGAAVVGNRQLHIKDIRRITRSLCSALAHCHEHGVIVRDLTPQNIMIRKNQQVNSNTTASGGTLTATFAVANTNPGPMESASIDVMIVDFSLSVGDGSIQVFSDHPCFEWNMVPYSSPEALLGHPYSFPTDMWSLGVLLYTMISCVLPFHHEDDHVAIENIRTASFDFEEDAFDHIDLRIKQLISSLLKAKATDRITAKQMLKDEWLMQ
jgi:serine/threonine protein kinase